LTSTSRRLAPLLATLLATLAGACAHGPPPLRATRVEVEDSGHGPRPFVRAMVAGKPLRLLLDTGATHSMLPASFVEAQRLRRRTSAADVELVDSNGHRATLGVAVDVPIQFEGEPTPTTLDFVVNPAPGWEEAILAPHELLRRGWAMTVDLERGELRLDPEDVALRRLGERGPARRVDFRTCRDEGLFNNIHRVVTASINGVPAEMLLDTGATRTALSRNNPALPSMAAASGRRGTSAGISSTGQGLLVDGVPVEFGGAAFVTPALVLAASQSCWEGAIGADLLRHCTMAWGWSTLWMACRPPGTPPPP